MKKLLIIMVCCWLPVLASPESQRAKILKKITHKEVMCAMDFEKSHKIIQELQKKDFVGIGSIDESKAVQVLVELLVPINANEVLVSKNLVGKWDYCEILTINKNGDFELILSKSTYSYKLVIGGKIQDRKTQILKTYLVGN